MKNRFSLYLLLGAWSLLAGACHAEPAAVPAAADKAATADATENPRVRLVTSAGNIDIELFPERAPLTVANFLELVDGGFYEGLIFHRVIAGFMVQGGGYEADMTYRKAPRQVRNESMGGLPNRKYSIAMARTSNPDSADSQFFINVAHNNNLDAKPGRPGYTVFGQVIDGEYVVTEIVLTETGREAGMSDVPTEDILILEARRL